MQFPRREEAQAKRRCTTTALEWTAAAAHFIFAPMPFTVTVSHDEDAGVWFVQSSDIPGLHVEAATLDELVEAVTDLAPELVAANLPEHDLAGVESIALRVEHVVNAPLASAA